MRILQWLGLSFCVLMFWGCGSEDDGGRQSTPTTATDSCKQWQDALIDFADHCSSADLAAYEVQTRTVHCSSDTAALDCVTQLEGGGCAEATLAGCDTTDLADRAAAEAACVSVSNAYCESAVRCGQFASVAECSGDGGGTGVDCTTALGWSYALEDCIAELGSLACAAPGLPASCSGVIVAGR